MLSTRLSARNRPNHASSSPSQWNRALVTGASSGIGREIARQLADRGTDLVIVARDEGRLNALREELSAVDVEVLVADLSARSDLAAVESRIGSEDRPIDLLVNNAGFGRGGPFIENDLGVATDVVEVNVVALLRLAHAAAVVMAPRERGGILNVSSLAGELIAPNSAVYSATKAFVTSLSESLHQELAPAGVVVSCVLPGFTHTEFQERAEVDVTSLPGFVWQEATEVASAALDGLDAGKARVVPGALNKVAGGVAHTLPKAILRGLGRGSLRFDEE